MRLQIKRQTIFGLLIIMFLSMANVLSVLAQVNIDDPTAGETFNATEYQVFNQDLDVSGGLTPYTYTATGLPDGLSVDVEDDGTDARIIGSATESGTFNVNLLVEDSTEPPGNTSGTVNFTIEVTANPQDIVINVPDVFEITEGTVNVAYTSLQFSTDDDVNESRFEWSISGSLDGLPSGMALATDGTLIGTPTESGEFFFRILVEDPDTGNTGARDYLLTVAGGATTGDLEIVSPSGAELPSGVLNRSYAADVDATGGDGNYDYEASGLPAGLSINSGTGVIGGTPTEIGTFNVEITVTDGNNDTVDRDYTLTITETGNAEYGSLPAPGSTIDFGDVNIGSTFTLIILVSEEGTDALDVSQPNGGLIQGPDAANFSVIANSPPFTIANGGADVSVSVRCTPSAEDTYDAFLQFATNDDELPVVVYSLFCNGVTEGGSADGDTGTVDGATFTPAPVATFTPSLPTQTPLPPTYGNVIEVRGLSLRTAPFIGATRRTVLRPDINYRVTAKNAEEGVYMWYYIITDDGIDGWASGRYLAIYGQDVPVAGSVMDNVFNERDRNVRVQALDNLNFRPRPSDRMPPYPDLIPWGAQLTVYARTVSGRGDEWYAVGYNGTFGWVYAPNTKIVQGLIDAIPIY